MTNEHTTPSLPLFPGPLCPGVVVSVKVPFLSKIDQFNYYLYSIRILNTI